MSDLSKPVLETRWISAEQPRRSVDARIPLLIAGVCAAFVASYAIGHATTGGGAARVEAPSSSQVATLNTAIPSALGAAVPLDARLVLRAPAPPAARPSAPAAVHPASTGPAAVVAKPPVVVRPNVAPVQPAPVSTPQPRAEPPPASTHTGSSPPSSGGSGSFDSSN